jgi:orotidine-5'-phosphate decarboxylase
MAEIIVALDLPSEEEALGFVDRLGDSDSTSTRSARRSLRASGPQFVRRAACARQARVSGPEVPRHPEHRGQRSESAAQLDVELVTLHASGGDAMMRAAREAVGDDGPRLLGVTILTSFTAVDVEQVWNKEILSVRDEVGRLANLAVEAGLHGVVTSPLEVESLKRRHGSGFIVVTPGIRPSGEGLGDQVRTATPIEAARAGSDFLVIGRPVHGAADPLAVVRAVLAELESVPQVAQ